VSPDAIVVLAGVVERDGKFLVSRRLKGTHLADLWEFPGGKCEPGESHEACLAREFREELDVDIDVGPEILTTEHIYPEKAVRLHFRRCDLRGEPQPVLGQEMRWITRDELQSLPFPEADRDLIRMLTS
jgi:mutator protein MutT